jgi:hypothetical protein
MSTEKHLSHTPPPTSWFQHGTRLAFLGMIAVLPCARAELPRHNVAAANLNVVQNDSGNTTASVTVTATVSVNDFRVRSGSNRADYNVQIGSAASDDVTNGVIITSITQNGRDNAEGTGTNYLIPTIDFSTDTNDNPTAYFIPVFALGTGASLEYNINVAGAYFPYTNWIGAIIRIAGGTNGGFGSGITNNQIIGTTGLAFGQNITNYGVAGKLNLNLASFGVDSRTDGVLLVVGGKNEGNYALSQPNADGTWTLFIKDKDANAASLEEDPIAFAFIPKSRTNVVSGRFLGSGAIDVYSGTSPQFTVSSNGVGTYELKVQGGYSATNGVLIISAENGGTISQDNFVSYQLNAAGDGWIIQTRDQPLPANLESAGATERVVSFVFIPGATPGITVTPTNNLFTSENAGTAQFSVVLHTRPSDTVTIPVSSSDLTEGTVSTDSLVFTTNDWNVPHVVNVIGQDDPDQDGSVAYTIVLDAASSNDPTYNGMNPIDVSVVNTDNEGGITVTPTSGLVTTEAGGTAVFSVHLNTPPAGGDVSIGLSSSNPGEGTVSPTNLIFTTDTWNLDQQVTITGINDFVADGTVAYTIITAPAVSADGTYNNLDAADVSVANTDNDVAGLTFNVNVLNTISVFEGRTTNYTVVLNSQPTTNVTVTLTASDSAQGGTTTPSITFTPADWNTPKAITITAADDLIQDGNTNWRVTNSISSGDAMYAALSAVAVPFTTIDNEALLTLPSGEMIYGIGSPGVGIDARAAISDDNTPNYAGVTLTVSITNNGTTDDRLEIRNTGTATGQIGVSGNGISYGATPIATFSGGIGTTPLSVSFNSSATVTSAEALLRNVTFRNVNANPAFNRRGVSVTLSHADGGTTTATTMIRVGLLHFSEFQEGADHGYGLYAGQADIQLRKSDPDTAYPNGQPTGLFIDWDSGNASFQALMRFDNIFGDGFGQIPSNAVIVSADLYLRIPLVAEDANAAGDGSPLHRMLRAWDATNETWNSFGGGVDQDDIESRIAFESAFGTAGGTSDTGTGTISFSVRPDLLAWQAGTNNYGWVMPGWTGNTDGTVVRSSEAAVISERPRLRVLWLPPAITGASFRQGVNNYTNAHDTRIRANTPDAEASTLTSVFVDWAVTGTAQNEDQVLIRFDNIIGSNPGQIPAGAQIHAAALDLATISDNGQGNGGQFFTMLTPWEDTNTWNALGNGIQTNGTEAASIASAHIGAPALTPRAQGGYNVFEMTSDVQAWANGNANYGWAVVPWDNGSDGWAISMSETAIETDRPRLRVYYTVSAPSSNVTLQQPTVTPTSVQIRFTGAPSTTYTVQRTAALGGGSGSWSPLGTATTAGNGTATFNDNAPLSSAAFYRISNP